MTATQLPLNGYIRYQPEAMRERAAGFYEEMARRRTVRRFSDEPVERRLPRFVDRPHAAGPEELKDLELGEGGRDLVDRGRGVRGRAGDRLGRQRGRLEQPFGVELMREGGRAGLRGAGRGRGWRRCVHALF